MASRASCGPGVGRFASGGGRVKVGVAGGRGGAGACAGGRFALGFAVWIGSLGGK